MMTCHVPQMLQVCPKLSLTSPDSYLDLGHKVKDMMHWQAAATFRTWPVAARPRALVS